ncbi:hypothetical protein PHIM7_176 [Sinorhizobium phage phiM7]|uniref:Uncharacterized protein n=3 Tax=Emdodecavirus TaxID=1980937 RepID=S5MPX1_9CAUD|nr:hypothetical protein AB690_gp323 [Sinorhizobium phage phiM12]YP_009212428.1 hypothetical protein AVT40_gp345 [Sinorhizobium phage phiN3]YP_009601301.1 hypothetical protein FDH46_gp302 [Sinorhizobium phage phiM7]AKF13081.1 hypothetical protein PHIM19_176 [Sinorhizobium phage phiM19]AGR47880.1 hypothetical protein SmphiM12_248 [Sinorhizobium phage phiM12]AKF12721.1 hypothetical protein PHIM7_176 [Sinorhizobium phage phiM7]AKF13451.1 hypothetical protein PHIN3_188 [Sinorhizobium phage phiN3]
MKQVDIILWLDRALKNAEHLNDFGDTIDAYYELRTDVRNLVRKLREEKK